MNIVLFGPPGAGKGTQGDNLVKDYNLIKVSTGDLLREESKKKNILSDKIKTIIDHGQFVSDEIIENLIEKVISNKINCDRLIFDGYPRNINQVKSLDSLMIKYQQKISCVLSLKIDKDSIVKRILGRQVCSNCGLIFNKYYNKSSDDNHSCKSKYLITRSDDNEKTIASRFDRFTKETLPILNYYQKHNLLHEINGMNKIDEIYKEIQRIIQSLETWLCNMYLYK